MKTRTKRPMRSQPTGLTGALPSQAPLANPYVPFQENDPPKYEARKALIRGTMYPGLDLPFLGMVNDQLKPDTLLSQLQSVNFAVQELALYLDTHREDAEALELYRSYQEMYRKLRKMYEAEKIDKPNPRLAAIIISQYGGPDGELGASMRYLSQRYSMPFDELKGLLTDIGTEGSK